MRLRAILSIALGVCIGATLDAKELFVAPDGSDDQVGTIDKPLASLMKAQDLAAPGDTVWIRGGIYKAKPDKVARTQRAWTYIYYFGKSGKAGQPIRYWAYKDEKPVFDCSEVKPPNRRINAFQVMGSWLHFRGFEVTGTQVNFKGHGQSCNLENHGSHNIVERLSLHDSQAIGIYALNGSDNLFLNCDAYNNYDYTSEDARGGNVDGFGCHPSKGSKNNVFRGCRAWFNSDDGYDCISAHEVVRFENCWAMYNGYGPKFEKRGDGNGFKVGGYGNTPLQPVPDPAPRHVTEGSLAVRNKASGFYANHHLMGCDWSYNSAYRNANDFNFLMRPPDNSEDIDGTGHRIIGNLSYRGNRDVTKLNAAQCELKDNAFATERKFTVASFESLDEAVLTGPRPADGSLPKVTFLKPKDAKLASEAGVTAYASKKAATK
jgi:hypothetical protein